MCGFYHGCFVFYAGGLEHKFRCSRQRDAALESRCDIQEVGGRAPEEKL